MAAGKSWSRTRLEIHTSADMPFRPVSIRPFALRSFEEPAAALSFDLTISLRTPFRYCAKSGEGFQPSCSHRSSRRSAARRTSPSSFLRKWRTKPRILPRCIAPQTV